MPSRQTTRRDWWAAVFIKKAIVVHHFPRLEHDHWRCVRHHGFEESFPQCSQILPLAETKFGKEFPHDHHVFGVKLAIFFQEFPHGAIPSFRLGRFLGRFHTRPPQRVSLCRSAHLNRCCRGILFGVRGHVVLWRGVEARSQDTVPSSTSSSVCVLFVELSPPSLDPSARLTTKVLPSHSRMCGSPHRSVQSMIMNITTTNVLNDVMFTLPVLCTAPPTHASLDLRTESPLPACRASCAAIKQRQTPLT